jgi:arginyl-tRNA synthetase
VVGAPQALHFRQIFSTQRRRGMDGDYRHIAFGSIVFRYGKFKSEW